MIDKGRSRAVSRYDDLRVDTVRREFAVVVVEERRLVPRRLSPIIEQKPIAFPPPRRTAARWWIAAVLAVPALAGAAWWAVGPGERQQQKVEVALPSGIEIDLPALPSTQQANAKAKAAPIVPVAKKAERNEVADSGRLLTLDKLPEVQAAVRKTFASGVAQSWQARGMEGYALAGPIQLDAAHVCRNIAIWAKGAGAQDGQTIGTRKCMAAGGAWIDVGKPETSASETPPAADRTAKP